MKKRPKPVKRVRQKVEPQIHRNRLSAGRVFRVHPESGRPFVVRWAAEECASRVEARAGMRGTGAWTTLIAAAEDIRDAFKP